ncbi:hypothetical protein OESDEN_25582 [Oesophagostomum dentatum]|uniref:Uncharacterized protein n=1 Tax=Oesophagostomum dentatum TaxID=61180 RepID=A0A0B1RUF8_OESDE|nr:hypothetical protein OESDEN_25582 [Oesophagostomum dentatum]
MNRAFSELSSYHSGTSEPSSDIQAMTVVQRTRAVPRETGLPEMRMELRLMTRSMRPKKAVRRPSILGTRPIPLMA